MDSNSKVFVAGHNGLVGSAIIRNLEKKNYNNIYWVCRENCDLTNKIKVDAYFNQAKPEYVFLAAAKVGGIGGNSKYPAEYIYDNLMIQSNVIDAAYRNDVKKLVFLGSSCIYPKFPKIPITEDQFMSGHLEGSNDAYAIAKIAGIKMCQAYRKQYGFNAVSVMPTNLYGPNDNFDLEKSHVVPALIRKIHLGKYLLENDLEEIKKDLNKNPIEGVDGSSSNNEISEVLLKYGVSKDSVEIWGSGKPMREFLWSEDMADACVFLLENRNFNDTFDSENTEIRNTHINIGTGVDVSIKDLAKLIKKEVGYKGGFIFNTSKPDGTMQKLTDVSKLNGLGWKHKVSLEKGVEKMYAWYLSE